METITFLRFFVLFASVADQGPLSAVAFSRITSSILKFGTDILTIIERNKKAIFREYFSSLCFYSGKIFMIIIFSRGPRATYCLRSKSTPALNPVREARNLRNFVLEGPFCS